mmetsp:Transcript_77820/g.225845  ORF Transcript_77820/g.225845 Transcript_77820/m.225845 type:complete len:99 (+) Transcript_77820:707-1003(+)
MKTSGLLCVIGCFLKSFSSIVDLLHTFVTLFDLNVTSFVVDKCTSWITQNHLQFLVDHQALEKTPHFRSKQIVGLPLLFELSILLFNVPTIIREWFNG